MEAERLAAKRANEAGAAPRAGPEPAGVAGAAGAYGAAGGGARHESVVGRAAAPAAPTAQAVVRPKVGGDALAGRASVAGWLPVVAIALGWAVSRGLAQARTVPPAADPV